VREIANISMACFELLFKICLWVSSDGLRAKIVVVVIGSQFHAQNRKRKYAKDIYVTYKPFTAIFI